jgi:superfamily II DNA or RNA helicase
MIQVGQWTLDHRQEHNAVGGCRNAFQSGRKHILMVAPTGFGKTVTTAAIADLTSRKGKKVGIIMSGRTLVFQMSDTLVDARVPHTVLMNDSDHVFDPNETVAVISKDTFSARRNSSLALSGYQPDLWIVDEADVCISDDWQQILKLAPLRIGMTATPCDGEGKGLGHTYDELIVAAQYSELIKDGRLVDVPNTKCYSPSRPSLAGLKVSGGDFNQKSAGALMDTPQLVGDVVKHWLLLGEDMPTLVCCVSKAHTVHVCNEFRKAGVAAEYVIDSTSQEEREEIFKKTRDGANKVIVNCATLTRGFDLPEIGCLVIAKPTKRLRTYIQMVGRALRAHPSKGYAILIDHSGSVWEHGWPTLDRHWSLDTDKKVEDLPANNKSREEQPERFCPKCTALLPKNAKVCPNPACGYQKTTLGQPAKTADGKLVSVKKKEVADKSSTKTPHQKVWSQMLGMAAHRGMGYQQAAAIFKKKTGVWPDGAGVSPIPEKHQRKLKVKDLWPGFGRTRKQQTPQESLFND